MTNKGIYKGIYFGDIHSFFDLNLILAPFVPTPAEPKENYVEITGGDGSLDFTEALGEVKFKDRNFSFTFSVNPSEKMTFDEKVSQVSNALNGKKCKITLDRDPDYYWDGRCIVDKYAQDKNLKQISIKATVRPYKLKQNETVVSSGISSSGGTKNTVSGRTIAVNDVSHVPHNVACIVKRKNIFNGELKVWNNLDRIMPKEAIKVAPNTWYTVSVPDYTIRHPIFAVYGNHTGTVGATTDTNLGAMVTTFNSGEFEYIWFRQWYPMTDDGITLDCRVQVEEGKSATEFTPYVDDLSAVNVSVKGNNTEAIYNPNENGIVEGITSTSPNMTISTDAGVIIEAEYYTDIPTVQLNLKNGRKSVVPVVNCTNNNTVVVFGGGAYTLNAGTHKILDLCLKEGNNPVEVAGIGTITFTYQEGEL